MWPANLGRAPHTLTAPGSVCGRLWHPHGQERLQDVGCAQRAGQALCEQIRICWTSWACAGTRNYQIVPAPFHLKRLCCHTLSSSGTVERPMWSPYVPECRAPSRRDMNRTSLTGRRRASRRCATVPPPVKGLVCKGLGWNTRCARPFILLSSRAYTRLP